MAKKKNILLVDDDGDLVEVQEILLTERGYSVQAARSAEKALEILKRGQKFDLLVTDVNLPKANGFQLAEEARLLQPDIPVLFVTGLADAEFAMVPKLATGMHIFRKPAPIEEFYVALDRAFAA
jgi:two-component system cell cycle sensor histidine kinase/response regulator CckA